jgi:Tfp pilus assembly protein PilZ
LTKANILDINIVSMFSPEERPKEVIYSDEKRLSQRFLIPGATVSYRKERLIFQKKDFDEEFCPLINLSRGGVRFASRHKLKKGYKILAQLSIPGERSPIILKGEVRWVSASASQSFPFQLGVQFNPYGNKKGQNYPGNLAKIISLEHKFAEAGQPETAPSDEYKIEDS